MLSQFFRLPTHAEISASIEKLKAEHGINHLMYLPDPFHCTITETVTRKRKRSRASIAPRITARRHKRKLTEIKLRGLL